VPPDEAQQAREQPMTDIDKDTPMTAAYVRVLVLEAAIVLALWFFGRLFS
jgi:hypothetical protein